MPTNAKPAAAAQARTSASTPVPAKPEPAPLAAVQPAVAETEDGPSLQVEDSTVEDIIAQRAIGRRIKTLRNLRSMGLVELGRHTGLSASFLSQLETGRVVPTLRNLARIAMVFSKDLNYFFEPEPQALFRMHRGQDRLRLPQSGTADPTYFFESLGYLVPDRQLDPYLAEFLPLHSGRPPRAHSHAGCEFLYVLSGALDVQHADITHHCVAGDAIYFDSTTVHSYTCVGTDSARALIVTLQLPVAATQPPRPTRNPPTPPNP